MKLATAKLMMNKGLLISGVSYGTAPTVIVKGHKG